MVTLGAMLRLPRFGKCGGRKWVVLEEFEPLLRFGFLPPPDRSTEARTWVHRTVNSWLRPYGVSCRAPFFACAGAGQCDLDAAALGLDGRANVLGRGTNP